jgi:hypothetical protein
MDTLMSRTKYRLKLIAVLALVLPLETLVGIIRLIRDYIVDSYQRPVTGEDFKQAYLCLKAGRLNE